MQKYLKFNIILLLVLFSSALLAQSITIEGKVFETNAEGEKIPLVGANIHVLGDGTGTATDIDGGFSLKCSPTAKHVVVSYTGYTSDTVGIVDQQQLNVELVSNIALDEVRVVYRKKSNEISYLNPIKIEEISEDELRKAACCNLSESFETSPSVDVSFTDAITGTRQIQMLGLAGPYAQITSENMPSVRGLSAIQGLVFVPGSWVEGMQLNKGTGSVLNGYESISGQINIELKKPDNTDRIHANFYGNEGGRLEGNLNLSHKFSDDASTAFFIHAKQNVIKHDRNGDGFLDQPIGNHFIGMNRWKFIPNERLRFQFGVKATVIDNQGGQLDFDPENNEVGNTLWGMTNSVERFEAWGKIGLLSALPWQSMGLQLSASHHQEDNLFGRNKYNANQTSLYANYIFQTILWNTQHGIKMGASIQYDDFDEELMDHHFFREEIVPGVYGEYTYTPSETFSLVAGLRFDRHNQYGGFVTPRFHLRKAFSDESVFRASFGRGQRTASVIAENFGILASSRNWLFLGSEDDNPYGLEPEVAWNVGLNYTKPFRLDYKDGSFSVDVYRTDFTNRVVVDLDNNAQEVSFYNVENASFSNTVQLQVDYNLLRQLGLRMAYRWVDSQIKYSNGWEEVPLNAKHRAFVNLAYTSNNEKWKFDATYNWQGSKRLPNTSANPTVYQLSTKSPSFSIVNTQVTRVWGSAFEVYLGMENVFDYRQQDAILSHEEPFGNYFDASMIWGPVFGRNTYLGLRYTLL